MEGKEDVVVEVIDEVPPDDISIYVQESTCAEEFIS